MKLTYAQQLQHPNWQRRRLEMLQAAGWQCSECQCDDKMLHVHHKQYFKGRMAWEYANHELAVLCEDCHGKAHDFDDKLKRLLTLIPQREAFLLLAGFYFDLLGQADARLMYAACEEDIDLVSIGTIAYDMQRLSPEERMQVHDSLSEVESRRKSTEQNT